MVEQKFGYCLGGGFFEEQLESKAMMEVITYHLGIRLSLDLGQKAK